MPTYMDVHEDLRLSQDTVDELTRATREREVDAHGVRQVELFHNPEGRVFCLLDAPDEDAVRQHHADLGVSCGDVTRVESLL